MSRDGGCRVNIWFLQPMDNGRVEPDLLTIDNLREWCRNMGYIPLFVFDRSTLDVEAFPPTTFLADGSGLIVGQGIQVVVQESDVSKGYFRIFPQRTGMSSDAVSVRILRTELLESISAAPSTRFSFFRQYVMREFPTLTFVAMCTDLETGELQNGAFTGTVERLHIFVTGRSNGNGK